MASIKKTDIAPDNDEELFIHGEIHVDKKQSPIRIDKFVMDRLEKVSRNRIQNAIKVGAILVNNKPIKSNYKIRPLDNIKIVLPGNPAAETPLVAQDIPLNIVFEDEDIMIINKQAGLVVHPGTGNPDGTLVNAIIYHLQNNNLPVMSGNPIQRPGLVHRIDKDTSGLMVIAKTELAMTHLAKQFFDHTIDREYIGLVWGSMEEEKGSVVGNIGRHPRERLKMYCFEDGEEGKHAVTHYEVIEDLYYVSLVKFHLETGRTHQIRVHMKHKGNTLFNDEKYGGNSVLKGTVFSKYKQFVENCFKVLPRQALHAKSLGFIHPRTEEKRFFESNVPKDFDALLLKWRKYRDIKMQ